MSFTNFLNDYINNKLRKVEQGFIAEIVSFDKKTLEAEIKPLLETTTENNGEEKTSRPPNIKNVPCRLLYCGGYYIRPVYVKGDKVKCSLTSSAITKPLKSNLPSDKTKNRFSLSYCIVDGGIPSSTSPPPQAFTERDGLLIGRGDTELIEIKDGAIEALAGEIVLNKNDPGGTLGVARLEDTTISNSSIDTAFWAFITALDAVISGTPIPEPGNGSPSALQSALALAIAGAGGAPSELTSKINSSSDTVKAGD